ncbi:hypothetical protein [Duganella flavida]|nr:hypothetical protein [Duganella flavida]
MIQTAAPTCKPGCTAPAKAPLMPKFSAELMKMLAQLVTLR